MIERDLQGEKMFVWCILTHFLRTFRGEWTHGSYENERENSIFFGFVVGGSFDVKHASFLCFLSFLIIQLPVEEQKIHEEN